MAADSPPKRVFRTVEILAADSPPKRVLRTVEILKLSTTSAGDEKASGVICVILGCNAGGGSWFLAARRWLYLALMPRVGQKWHGLKAPLYMQIERSCFVSLIWRLPVDHSQQVYSNQVVEMMCSCRHYSLL